VKAPKKIFHPRMGSLPGSDYTEDEVEWLRAIDRYKSETGKQQLSAKEILMVAHSLGYRNQKPIRSTKRKKGT